MLVSPALQQRLGDMAQGPVVTDDGVTLLYQSFGEGPAVVFGNGIGVRYPGAVEQVNALRDAYRVICWDYRGIGQSVMSDPEGDLSMARHARDILTILDALRIERAVFVGWSMGAQVSLEAIRLQPERVAGLVALLGTYKQPFRTAFPDPVGGAVEGLFELLHRYPAVAQAALDLAVALPTVAFTVLSRLPFVGRDADREVFAANVRSVAGVDKRLYTRTMLALAAHDASDVLPQVRCPTLVICGERDNLTPPKVARQMAAAIGGAEYREVTGGTHFALIEQPVKINRWLRELVDRVYGAPAG
jgi:pimeloyl-ACP methyl ester carboxylesterase